MNHLDRGCMKGLLERNHELEQDYRRIFSNILYPVLVKIFRLEESCDFETQLHSLFDILRLIDKSVSGENSHIEFDKTYCGLYLNSALELD